MIELALDLQLACEPEPHPDQAKFQQWLYAALNHNQCQTIIQQRGLEQGAELTVRLVTAAESQTLNHQYRDKDKPTNVLSFPFEIPADVPCQLLGDLVICASVVIAEAEQQDKAIDAHWAHMSIHGLLHLLGFDHQEDTQATAMERLETQLLQELGYPNPYE